MLSPQPMKTKVDLMCCVNLASTGLFREQFLNDQWLCIFMNWIIFILVRYYNYLPHYKQPVPFSPRD